MFFLVVVLSIFLFVGGESQQQHRLIKDLWDGGHLVLFGLLIFLFFSRPSQSTRPVIYKVIVTSISCLLLGTAIEIIQLFTHREFSTSDIINDLIGGYLGLICLLMVDQQQPRKLRVIAAVIFIVGSLLGLRNLEKHLIDEYRITQQFPLLAGFETEWELERWEHSLTELKRSANFVKSGSYSLQVTYLPGRYPNISLQHMQNNWSGYSQLTFSVYNPMQHDLNFELKVYDASHIKRGRKYSDRFNHPMTFAPGWNTIDIPLTDIIDAPAHRSMDIRHVRGLSLFTDQLAAPVTLYLDHVTLQ